MTCTVWRTSGTTAASSVPGLSNWPRRRCAEDPGLESLTAYAEDSGEGRWTVLEGVERGVNVGVLSQALFARFTSRQDDPFAMRMIAALRNQFGGHAVRPADR